MEGWTKKDLWSFVGYMIFFRISLFCSYLSWFTIKCPFYPQSFLICHHLLSHEKWKKSIPSCIIDSNNFGCDIGNSMKHCYFMHIIGCMGYMQRIPSLLWHNHTHCILQRFLRYNFGHILTNRPINNTISGWYSLVVYHEVLVVLWCARMFVVQCWV